MAYGTFLLITVVGVGLVVAAATAGVLCLLAGIHPAAWTALAVAGVAGALGTLVALSRDTAEVRFYLVFLVAAYVMLTAVSIFEVWRGRWVRRRWAAPSPEGVGPPARGVSGI